MPQDTLFDQARMQMNEALELTIASLRAHAEAHRHWAIAWSGGKDSTAVLTLALWCILTRRVRAPETLTVLYADTRLEIPPLWLVAQTIRREPDERGAE